MRNYRGKTKEGRWVKGGYCKVDGKHYIIPDDAKIRPLSPGIMGWGITGFIEVIPETVGQFVCKDKNDKDVYKEDAVKVMRGWCVGHIGLIKMEDGEYIIEGKESSTSLGDRCQSVPPRDIEVIGSIHENPIEEKE